VKGVHTNHNTYLTVSSTICGKIEDVRNCCHVVYECPTKPLVLKTHVKSQMDTSADPKKALRGFPKVLKLVIYDTSKVQSGFCVTSFPALGF
jgi:hypothetical protein